MKRPLRILLICQQDLGGVPHPLPAYRFWRTYFIDSLSETEHEVLEIPVCDWAAGLLPMSSGNLAKWRGNTWTRAIDWIRREHQRQPINLTLAYLYPQQVESTAVSTLQTELGIPVVNFFCDNVREFRRVPSAFAPFALHWVPEFAAVDLYRRANLPALHAPMPCHIPRPLRSPAVETNPMPLFIGTRDELRAGLLADAFSKGLEARVHGVGWIPETSPSRRRAPSMDSPSLLNQFEFITQHGLLAWLRKMQSKFSPPVAIDFNFTPFARPPLPDGQFLPASRETSVCLGINRFPSPRHARGQIETYSRLRDIEAPMAGACYLTEAAPGLDQLFDLENEIWTYRNADELVDQSRRLQADPRIRSEMRVKAQRRARQEHSIPRTIERLREWLSI